MENCKHTTVLFTSGLLKLQELPGNSPTTVKEDSESEKKLKQRTQERRERFIINKGNFHQLLQNHPYHKKESRKEMNIRGDTRSALGC